MSIAKDSVFFRLFLALWLGLRDLWQGSFLHRVFAALGEKVRLGVQGSAICQFLWRDGTLTKAWPRSQSCQVISALVNLPCALVKLVYKAGKNLWDGSFFLRLLTALGGAGSVLMGLFMLVMLAAPHGRWNNVYGLLGAVGVTALFIFSTGSRRSRLEVERLGPYLVMFFGLVCVALVSSLSTALSLRFFLFHVTCLLIVLVMVSATQNASQLQGAVVLASAGLFVASLYGCYQGVIGVPVVASQQDMSVNAGMPGRVYSFFDNPNNFAEILVMLLPFLLALFLNSETLRGKALSLVVLVVGLMAIGYTLSRSGWLGLALAVFVFLALQNWRIVPLALVMGILALPFLPDSIYNRILTIGNLKDTSTLYRFAIYDATANLMKDYWATGVGLGSDIMKKAFATYPTLFDGNHPIHTHNNYLQMWGELGLAGGLAYLALVLGQLKSGVKAFYCAGNRRVKNLLAAAIGSFCGILLVGVAEYTWFYPRNMFFFWFLFGIIAACVKLVRQEKS